MSEAALPRYLGRASHAQVQPKKENANARLQISHQLGTPSIRGTAVKGLVVAVAVSAQHVPESLRGALTETLPLLRHRQLLLLLLRRPLLLRLLRLLRLLVLLLLAVALCLRLLTRGARVVARRVGDLRGRASAAAACGRAVASGAALRVVGWRALGSVWRDARRGRVTVDAVSVLDVRHPARLGVKLSTARLHPRASAGARARDLPDRRHVTVPGRGGAVAGAGAVATAVAASRGAHCYGKFFERCQMLKDDVERPAARTEKKKTSVWRRRGNEL